MDQNRWLIVLAVVCMMLVTLTLLHRYYGVSKEYQDDQPDAAEYAGTGEVEQPVAAVTQGTDSRREMVSAVVVPPPPAFFFTPATPEEDGRGVQELMERGKALKPDVFVASQTGKSPGTPEGRR